LCARLGIAALDLLPGFAERAAVSSEPLFWPNDGHWNAAGHRLAAELLSGFLRDQAAAGP
jgi:hypothetical protein